jgi:hypothetical protein
MAARHINRPDELHFRQWLNAHGETDSGDFDEILLHVKKLIQMIDFSQYKTDEQVYIGLFGRKTFNTLDDLERSKLKRAAILYHYFIRSSSA